MSEENPQDQTPVYSFQGDSPGAELLEIARIHHKEAKQLFESAHASEAEGRQQEAKLLFDLATSREERAVEFERAARGEGGDPIVTEILADQEEVIGSYSPHKSTYTATLSSTEQEALDKLAEYTPPPPTRMARAKAWISRMMK